MSNISPGSETVPGVENEQLARWYFQKESHEQNLLYQRINIFLLASSVVVVGFAGAVQTMDLLFLIGTGLLGLVIALSWLRVVHRQVQIVDWLKERLLEVSTCYRDWTKFAKEKEMAPDVTVHHVSWILYRALPMLFILFWSGALVWIALAYFQLLPHLSN